MCTYPMLQYRDVDPSKVAEFLLARNNLTGPVPWRELATFKFLLVVDMAGNRLTGAVPLFEGLDITRMERIDLSDNQLEGMISDNLRPELCCRGGVADG